MAATRTAEVSTQVVQSEVAAGEFGSWMIATRRRGQGRGGGGGAGFSSARGSHVQLESRDAAPSNVRSDPERHNPDDRHVAGRGLEAGTRGGYRTRGGGRGGLSRFASDRSQPSDSSNAPINADVDSIAPALDVETSVVPIPAADTDNDFSL